MMDCCPVASVKVSLLLAPARKDSGYARGVVSLQEKEGMSRKVGTMDETDGLGRIRIAVELDSGGTEQEVASLLGIPVSLVQEVATTAGFREKQGASKRSRRTTEAERSVAVSRIAGGESPERIAEEIGVTVPLLARWCRRQGVTGGRTLDQLSGAEQKEVRQLLESGEQEAEVREAYGLTREALEELQEPEYQELDSESLGFLYEILREQPRASNRRIAQMAGDAGLELLETAVVAYRQRLQRLEKL